MTTPDPLVAFAEARISEDEAAAQSALDPDETGRSRSNSLGTWDFDGSTVWDGWVRIAGAERSVSRYAVAPEFGPHIARHDPARVLRECAGRRRTLARHQPEPHPGHGTVCAACIEHGNTSWPCADTADLVATWADHDDYQESWTP